MHVRSHVNLLAQNRRFLREHDYFVLSRHKLNTVYAPSRPRPSILAAAGDDASSQCGGTAVDRGSGDTAPRGGDGHAAGTGGVLGDGWVPALLVFVLGVMVGRWSMVDAVLDKLGL